MNSLYTLALRQSSSLESDLGSLSHAYSSSSARGVNPNATSALHGQINASLAAFDRTIEDYDSMAKREIVDQKREKALQRVARFREDYGALRKRYERIKTDGTSNRIASERNELFTTPTTTTTTTTGASSHSYSASHSLSNPSNRSTATARPSSSDTTTINFGGGGGGVGGGGGRGFGGGGGGGMDYGYDSRTNHALREHDFFSSTSQTLDAYLAQGQAVLGNLATQRDVMKGTKRRLLSAANTLGLSRETIQFIERRTKADWWILVGGGGATLVCFGLILKYFG